MLLQILTLRSSMWVCRGSLSSIVILRILLVAWEKKAYIFVNVANFADREQQCRLKWDYFKKVTFVIPRSYNLWYTQKLLYLFTFREHFLIISFLHNLFITVVQDISIDRRIRTWDVDFPLTTSEKFSLRSSAGSLQLHVILSRVISQITIQWSQVTNI